MFLFRGKNHPETGEMAFIDFLGVNTYFIRGVHFGIFHILFKKAVITVFVVENTVLGHRPNSLKMERDSGENKQDEESELVRLERLTLALQLTNSFVFDQDTDFRFVRVYNPMYGYTEEGFVGKTDEDFISADYARKILPIKKRVLKTGKSEQVDFSAEVAGSLRHYLLRVLRIEDENGVVSGITVIGSDISVVRQSETKQASLSARLDIMKRYESMAVMAEVFRTR